MLDPTARVEVEQILSFKEQDDTFAALDQACNWPDRIRDTAGWEWTSPMHYVNIPRSTRAYSAQRDCPDGRCVTAAINRYANELAQPELSPERRWQALAFLCHFVGDVHQPLHAGFRDDRGANQVIIEYKGEEWNLHRYWDSVVVHEKLGDEAGMIARIAKHGQPQLPAYWNPHEAVEWTEASHALAVDAAYPDSEVVSQAFADNAWQIIQAQWQDASVRLASVLNAVLGESEVVLED